MNKNQVFIGDIKQCTKYKNHVVIENKTYIENQLIGTERIGHMEISSQTVKRNAVILKFNDKYVELLKIKTILDYLKVLSESKRSYFTSKDICMSLYALFENAFFVDVESLKPYFNWLDNESISLRQLKKEVKERKQIIH